MLEKKIILIPINSENKSKILSWSETLELFDLTSKELEKAINEGLKIKQYYIDELL